MTTFSVKPSQIKRTWHKLDARGQILGRLSTKIARLLQGKHKPYFTPNLDCGDYVVVTNTDGIKVSGKKALQKLYFRHSNYPGGFKQIKFSEQLQKDSRRLIYLAVKNMLPKNKLRALRLKRLRLFTGEEDGKN